MTGRVAGQASTKDLWGRVKACLRDSSFLVPLMNDIYSYGGNGSGGKNFRKFRNGAAIICKQKSDDIIAAKNKKLMTGRFSQGYIETFTAELDKESEIFLEASKMFNKYKNQSNFKKDLDELLETSEE